jgi:sensor histidine kinase YesM
MNPPRDRRSAFERVQLFVVLWLALSSIARGGASVTFPGYQETPPTLTSAPGAVLLHVLAAVLHAVFAFRASRRFPLWDRPGRAVALHLGVLAAIHAITFACDHLQGYVGGGDQLYGGFFYVRRTFEYVVYTLFAHGMLYGEHRHEGEREELRLRARMAASTAARTRAQVRALRMEWSPHFLTETLEAIGGLLARDAAAAKRMLLGLSAVLRRVLAQVRTDGLRLEQEMALVDDVLRVESMRRPELVVEREIDDAVWELPVPHMALLTLVYQALREDGAVRIRIHAGADGDGVRLRVDAFDAEGRASTRSAVPEAVAAAAVVEPDERPAPAPAVPVAARSLEAVTYAILILLNTLFAVHAEWTRVAEGDIALATPAWVYVAGSGLYAALWWGSFVMMARFLTARFPIRQAGWARAVAAHVLGAVVVALANAVAYGPFQYHLVRGGSLLIGLRSHWQWGDLAVYVPLAGIAHGFAYAREYQARRLSELRLRSLLAESELHRTESELQALKSELNPHFLFNALNTVSSLMHTRPDDARRVVAHLSALLRRVLESSSLQEVSVEEEVEFIRLYMEIERARFGDALRIEYRLDPATLRARVPHLLIQPLVENAVKHGLRPRDGTGEVMLTTRREGDFLRLMVEDDGVGPTRSERAEGIGLAHVRQRLRQLYGDAQSFELAAAPRGGAAASIRIPFTELPRTAPA